MELVLYACLMIVPIISVAAFILSLISMGKFKKLQSLVITLGHNMRKTADPISEALNDYEINKI